VIFDRGFKNLADVVVKALKMIPKIFPTANYNHADLKWTFPDGETLVFRHIRRMQDYNDYHGQEFPFIGFNELTSYSTSDIYDAIKSCNRSGFLPDEHSPDKLNPLPDIPLVMFSTTNPHGRGHNWVKRRWIDKAAPGVMVTDISRVFNPRTQQKEDVSTTRVHIFGSYKENKYLNPKYIAGLDGITEPNKRRAWLGGDWSITSGGALDDLWKAGVHIVPRFIVPKRWRVTRSFDWGTTSPFSVGFWAIANGEEVELPGGRMFCPDKGSRIRIGEIYGAERGKNDLGQMVPIYETNRGTGESIREVARQIVEFQEELFEDGWIETHVEPGPADGSIFTKDPDLKDRTKDKSDSLGKVMEREGVSWDKADRSPGSRKIGLELVRVALENAVQGEGAGLYVMDNCPAFIETVPMIPRDEDDPDDVDTNSIDHCYDEVRYMVLEDKPLFASKIDIDFAS
jgi:hypothetical protein